MRFVYLILSSAVSFISGNPINENCKECNKFVYDADGQHRFVPDEKSFYNQATRSRRGFTDAFPIESLMNILNPVRSLNSDGSSIAKCAGCAAAVSAVKLLILFGRSDNDLIKMFISLCSAFRIMPSGHCKGIIETNGPALLAIIRKSTGSYLEMCSYFIKEKCQEPDSSKQWNVQIPKIEKPKVCDVQLPPEDAPKLKFLLISDPHMDPSYVEGTPAECSVPLCCRAETGDPKPGASVAGKWGGWECDLPKRTIENLLEHITTEHSKFDVILLTGDITPHDSWFFDKYDSIEVQNTFIDMLAKNFPNTPIYAAVGNHDTVPMNLFPTTKVDEKFTTNWLYDDLQKQWSPFLPEDTAVTIRRGGFYTALIRPGFRIISLNTNYCFTDNWWLILNNKDPLSQLQWLIDVLQSAEDNNEKVLIIGHVSPGSPDCIDVWKKNYYDIVCRYECTIAAQFFGHSHLEEFELYLDRSNCNKACGVGHLIPSVTSHTGLNLGYQIAYIDGDRENTSRRVLDIISYVFDLEKANRNDVDAVWKVSHSAKTEYNMTSLSPEEWKKLLDEMSKNNQLFDRYYKHSWKNSPKRSPCDESCKKKYLHQIRSCGLEGK